MQELQDIGEKSIILFVLSQNQQAFKSTNYHVPPPMGHVGTVPFQAWNDTRRGRKDDIGVLSMQSYAQTKCADSNTDISVYVSAVNVCGIANDVTTSDLSKTHRMRAAVHSCSFTGFPFSAAWCHEI